MEITCEHCGAKLNIPDERIPRGQAFRATCPLCKKKLQIAGGKREPDGLPNSEHTGIPTETAASSTPSSFEDEDEAPDYYDEGIRSALVMGEDVGSMGPVKEALESLGFKCAGAENTRKALGKMRLHHFDLVIFKEGFGGVLLDQSPILHYLNHLSMHERRRMFIATIGRHFKTMDRMTSFALSVDLAINEKDLDQLPVVLKRSMSEKEKFYKVFMEALKETGKA